MCFMTKYIFLGPPGAGKGTMAKRLAVHANLVHISTGDLFRDAIARETPLGLRVKAIIDRGDLVPDEVTVDMLKERIDQADCGKGFILDGFPRTIPQAEALATIAAIDAVINFTLDDASVVERLSGRRVCAKCNRNYHIRTMPPKRQGRCDDCGSALYTRKDDQIESIRNRLVVYQKQTAPLIDYFLSRGVLKNIDAAGDVETVFSTLRTATGK
jgi:adenylate kinase